MEKGIITKIYESTAYWLSGRLLARGIDKDGRGFSNRQLELDNNLQPQVTLDDGQIINEVKVPANTQTNSQS